jgi:hypothetical protein
MPRNAVDYEEDFYAWTVEQARLLRSGELSTLDAANLAEEVESIGRSDRRAIESRLTVLLAHLLKWQMQPGSRSTSWSGTIREQRRQIERLLRDSPSLRPGVAAALSGAYNDARRCGGRDRTARGRIPRRMPVHCGRGAVALVSAGAVSG